MEQEKTIYSGEIPNTPIRFFLYVSKRYWVWATIATVLVVIAAATSVGMRLLIEQLVAGIESMNYGDVFFWGLMYPVFFFVASLFWRASGMIARKWLLGAPKTATDVLSTHVSGHSHSYFSDRFAGSVSNKMSNVSSAMEEFVAMFLWSYVEQLVPVLITGVIFLYTDVTVGLLFFGLIASSILLNTVLIPRKKRFSLALAASQSKTTGFIVDILSNIQTVRQYVTRDAEERSIAAHTNEVREKGSISFLYSEYMMLMSSLLFTGFAIAMFDIMLTKWTLGEISSGRLLSFVLLVTYSSGTVIFLGRMLSNTAKVYGRAQEGLDEIMINHEIVDAPDASKLAVKEGSVVWQGVTFAYQENDIFKRLSLTIQPGQRVGLVGPSGAGKSTFVSLLLRQHDIQYGQIMIGGQNIAQVTQDSLRQNIALVPQEPMLFHRTIRENILYGNSDATEEEIKLAAKRAQAHEFIVALPDGYDTLVGERGVKLSGGQKQRVAIARAMLKEAPVLVLDEATSALDSESEVAIQRALEELMEGKTVMAVAHRLSTLRKMDRILVFEQGKIIEDGTHDELVAQEGLYSKLWQHQAGGFLQD